MKFATISAVAIAAAFAVTAPAFAKGGGPEGASYWLQKNPTYNKAHPVRTAYACKAGSVLVVRAAPCGQDVAIASAK